MTANKIGRSGREIVFNPEMYTGLVARNKDNRKFNLWKNNSLGNFISWTLFEFESQYFIRRIVWKQHSGKLDLSPITYGAEKEISSDIVNILFNVIEKINFNNRDMDDLIAIDGIRQGIVFNGAQTSWLEGEDPKLDHAFEIIMNELKDLFLSHNSQIT